MSQFQKETIIYPTDIIQTDVPKVPFYLIASIHQNVTEFYYIIPPNSFFYCGNNIKDIVELISNYLNNNSNIYYDYNNKYNWKVMFTNNSIYTKFNISIYKQDNNYPYIFEMYYYSGDKISIYQIFNDLKYLLESPINKEEPVPCFEFTICDLFNNENMVLLSDEELKENLLPIKKMIDEDGNDGKYIASKLLCDLTFNNKVHEQLCNTDIIEIFINLLMNKDDDIHRFSMIALRNLSYLDYCKNNYLKSKI